MTQPTELQDGTPTPSHPTLTALVVLTGVFLSSLDLFIVNIAFPSISLNFHGESLSSLSWILSAYTIVFAALLVPAGRWADRAGRKRVSRGRVRDAAAATGATLAELMARLGHSTPSAAMRYQHAAQGRDRQIAKLLSKLVAPEALSQSN